MGQTLSEPITEKHTTDGEDDQYAYGASAMQGWRISMEDAHTTLLKLTNGPNKTAFFAVYDGHGGQNVAKYCGSNLHDIIARTDSFQKQDYEAALKSGFLNADVDLRNDPNFSREPSGCTSVTAIITDTKIFVGNAGDSRAVLCTTLGQAEPLSFDHKPGNPAELDRIVAAGGFVEFGRVNGNLALSRAIGDFEFKQAKELPAEKQTVTAFPDVTEWTLRETDEFLVLACDGIWDCMTNQEVVDFVTEKIVEKHPLGKICELLMEHCLAPDSEVCGVGCDNMTVVIVALLRGRTTETWCADVCKRVEEQGGVSKSSAVVRQDPPDDAAPAEATLGSSQVSMASSQIHLTPAELSKFDGSDPNLPVYVAIKGTVFDVTSNREMYTPGQGYSVFAGKDASRALGMSKLQPELCVSDYSTLTEEELNTLENWFAFYTKKYPVVGKVSSSTL
ncbi:hypothetical protein BASA50_001619 [Batrachochytrium salamandrivorans]|uniref:protein-serine/threonine phosphatase n=1 Tax=Batrachochytrium salamandrivorans TaxID=1357716 RepID=A0ABQ8FRN0_9FUNG|nr:hypothetical protein BASA60_010078 [Batrachochytrium salamandrivorans]KAH6575129.1 hypothetical protein BASA62_002107 [Batrachochytrium salamandrivorans]KAH6587381.1 hypothetical protein BASA61_006329 [Batrachochytrium salamandrivorans]KAH6601430.1 hypothetical protein BASA50_001619 [Batrachochytrium salamandrivorans]KAH9272904.1 hypothetical protein BASA83_004794 [Batrachochytrium salamandrivorans]